ncbi:hypothetical protein M8C21_008245, partial [Ambrosia artemisiifolia]
MISIESSATTVSCIAESDIANLPYLRCIINETLRMYSVGTLLIPNDVQLEGITSHAVRVTMLLVNQWAIHHDPKVWDDPESLIKLKPFGSGRRGSLGEGLAVQMLGMTLGSIIQCFKWEQMSEDAVDMTEGPGINMTKAIPLVAKCGPRVEMMNLLSVMVQDDATMRVSSCFTIKIRASYLLTTHIHRKSANLPPTVFPAFPIIGHLYLLKKPLYRTLAKISAKYGPVLFLRFGFRRVLLISSPSAAEECFTKNDIIFANRPHLLFGKIIGNNYTSLGWASYGDNWRNLRRIASIEILSTPRLNEFHDIRVEEGRLLVRKLMSNSSPGGVKMRSVFYEVTLNVMMRMISGKRYFGGDIPGAEEEGQRLREMMDETFLLHGAANVGDYLRVSWLGVKSLENRLIALQEKLDVFIQRLIEQLRTSKGEMKTKTKTRKTMVEVLLSLQESDPEYYTDQMIRGFVQVMIFAGTDTSSGTMEWCLSLLLNHPQVLQKAQNEIDRKVGKDRLVGERGCPGEGLAIRMIGLTLGLLIQCFDWERLSDKMVDMKEGLGVTLPKAEPLVALCKPRLEMQNSYMVDLPYLRGIINETLRLYPTVPVIVPHESSQDCIIEGYNVPSGTMLLHDPKLWTDPERFNPERTLAKISAKYGPVLFLRLGFRRVLVISSPSAAEECFTKNDIIFANRPHLLFGKIIGNNYTSLGWVSYGDHWRNLRRIASLEILSTPRLNEFHDIRVDEGRLLIRKLMSNSSQGRIDSSTVNLRSVFYEVTLNMMMRMISGKRYFGGDIPALEEEGERFKEMMDETFLLSGATNIGDYLPVSWLGVKSLEKKLIALQEKLNVFFQKLIEQLRTSKGEMKTKTRKTMVMLFAGTDTSSGTMEWCLSLLLNHPQVLRKAQNEMDRKIGKERLVDESDMVNLPYLRGIINETLRLYPTVPLLVPHESSQDCIIEGYNVPCGTMLLVNQWAIHHDPKLWTDPERFNPDRFEGLEGTRDGFKLMPFGSGRRGCLGEGLAVRMIGLTLGLLIQCFDWEQSSDKMVDMKEGLGVTMPKAEPLVALCKP